MGGRGMTGLPAGEAVARCPLFAGLQGEQLHEALRLCGAREKRYAKGETIKRVFERLPAFGLVLEGAVQAAMDDFDGRPMLLSHIGPGGTFGEALWVLGRESPVYIVADSACRVLWLSVSPAGGGTDMERLLSARLTAMLAERVLAMNDRIRILTQTSLRQKLTALLSQYEKRRGSAFMMPMGRAAMAAYLGVNRSALSRELSRMQAQGILTFHRRRFTLLGHRTEQG